jgi:formyltetrahydrofolate-dependent phosphoribosylglycinamide formyltransferase
MAAKRTAILISGRGSNMAALIRAAREDGYPAEIAGVISDRADVEGLDLAARAGVPTQLVERPKGMGREAHDAAIGAALAEIGAEIVCLAGYMRLLTPGFVAQWSGRMLNIHPSLLPLFKGLHPHRQAIAAGVRIHGCTVHFVTAETDSGPIVAQAAVPVLPSDSEGALASKVLEAEHRLYPFALKLVASGRAALNGDRVTFSNVAAAGSLFSPEAAASETDIESLARMTP